MRAEHSDALYVGIACLLLVFAILGTQRLYRYFSQRLMNKRMTKHIAEGEDWGV